MIIDGEGEENGDEDPHAAALARKPGDEEGGDEDPHAAALARKGLDSDIDPDGDGTPIWKDEDDQDMKEGRLKEDNNITDPTHNEYNSEAQAEKDGHGDVINKEPQFSDKDYDGTKGANTGKQKPSAGLDSATKK